MTESIPLLEENNYSVASNTAIRTEEESADTSSPKQIWLFQANPQNYRIFESLASEREELWNLNQHAKRVRIGDRVVIWVAGPEAGIYAVGTVISSPDMTIDSQRGQGYWRKTNEGNKKKPRVGVRYDKVLLDRPLSKAFIRTDPVLCELKVLAMHRGTNYPVTEEEWNAIHLWLQISQIPMQPVPKSENLQERLEIVNQ